MTNGYARVGMLHADDVTRRTFGVTGAAILHLLLLALVLIPGIRGSSPAEPGHGPGRPATVFSLSGSGSSVAGVADDPQAGAERASSAAASRGEAAAPRARAEKGAAPDGAQAGDGGSKALDQAIAGAVADDPLGGDDWYRAALRRHLAMHRQSPLGGQGARSGTVVVRFTLAREGRIVDARVVSSRGPRLDQAALATLWHAEPLPAVPSSLSAPIEIDVPVDFVERG